MQHDCRPRSGQWFALVFAALLDNHYAEDQVIGKSVSNKGKLARGGVQV